MRELVFLLEEESARAMLEGLVPRILPEKIQVRYLVFAGKQDLEKQLARRIRGYRNQQARFVILRDQDSHPDCRIIKSKLVDLCTDAGRTDSLIRIACRELESFYLADLAAVERGLGLSDLVWQQNNRKFREPDYLGAPARELSALTKSLYENFRLDSGMNEVF